MRLASLALFAVVGIATRGLASAHGHTSHGSAGDGVSDAPFVLGESAALQRFSTLQEDDPRDDPTDGSAAGSAAGSADGSADGSSTEPDDGLVCDENNVCNIGEDAESCASDCQCGDNMCHLNEYNTASCPSDCAFGRIAAQNATTLSSLEPLCPASAEVHFNVSNAIGGDIEGSTFAVRAAGGDTFLFAVYDTQVDFVDFLDNNDDDDFSTRALWMGRYAPDGTARYEDIISAQGTTLFNQNDPLLSILRSPTVDSEGNIILSLASSASLVLNLPGEKELSIPDDSESSNGKASFIIKYDLSSAESPPEYYWHFTIAGEDNMAVLGLDESTAADHALFVGGTFSHYAPRIVTTDAPAYSPSGVQGSAALIRVSHDGQGEWMRLVKDARPERRSQENPSVDPPARMQVSLVSLHTGSAGDLVLYGMFGGDPKFEDPIDLPRVGDEPIPDEDDTPDEEDDTPNDDGPGYEPDEEAEEFANASHYVLLRDLDGTVVGGGLAKWGASTSGWFFDGRPEEEQSTLYYGFCSEPNTTRFEIRDTDDGTPKLIEARSEMEERLYLSFNQNDVCIYAEGLASDNRFVSTIEDGLRAYTVVGTSLENPSPSFSDNKVLAILEYEPTTMTLSWNVWADVPGATMAHIHGPAGEGQEAGVWITLADNADDVAAQMSGSQVITAANVRNLIDGQYYVNVHAVGDVKNARGQLYEMRKIAYEPDEDFTVHYAGVATGAKMATPVETDGTANILAELEGTTLRMHVMTDISSANQIAVYGPVNGPDDPGTLVMGVFDLDNPDGDNERRDFVFTLQLTATSASYVTGGRAVAVVRTVGNRDGVARTFLTRSQTLFAGIIQGYEEVPRVNTFARGSAIMWVDVGEEETVLNWSVHHTAAATSAHLHGPAGIQEVAGVAIAFASGGNSTLSPISGSTTLGDSLTVEDLQTGMYYVNVHTNRNRGGELRGQMIPLVETEPSPTPSPSPLPIEPQLFAAGDNDYNTYSFVAVLGSEGTDVAKLYALGADPETPMYANEQVSVDKLVVAAGTAIVTADETVYMAALHFDESPSIPLPGTDDLIFPGGTSMQAVTLALSLSSYQFHWAAVAAVDTGSVLVQGIDYAPTTVQSPASVRVAMSTTRGDLYIDDVRFGPTKPSDTDFYTGLSAIVGYTPSGDKEGLYLIEPVYSTGTPTNFAPTGGMIGVDDRSAVGVVVLANIRDGFTERFVYVLTCLVDEVRVSPTPLPGASPSPGATATPDATPTPTPEEDACDLECSGDSVIDREACTCFCRDPVRSGADCSSALVWLRVAGDISTFVVDTFKQELAAMLDGVEADDLAIYNVTSGSVIMTVDFAGAEDPSASATELLEIASEPEDPRYTELGVLGSAGGNIGQCSVVDCSTTGGQCISGVCEDIDTAEERYDALEDEERRRNAKKDDDKDGGSPVGIIVGVIGAVVVIGAIAAAVVVMKGKKAKSSASASAPKGNPPSGTEMTTV